MTTSVDLCDGSCEVEHTDHLWLKSMARLMAGLTPAEVKILTMRHGLDGGPAHTLAEVGDAYFGLSAERVRQIERAALWKLRRAMAADLALVEVAMSMLDDPRMHRRRPWITA